MPTGQWTKAALKERYDEKASPAAVSADANPAAKAGVRVADVAALKHFDPTGVVQA